jgi:hypothetical protein
MPPNKCTHTYELLDNTNISARSWTMQRQVTSIAWENGSLISTTTLANDNSNEIFTYVKANNGDIFDLDTPGCPLNEIGTNVNHTAEIHENFFEYVSVNIGNEVPPNQWTGGGEPEKEKPLCPRIQRRPTMLNSRNKPCRC